MTDYVTISKAEIEKLFWFKPLTTGVMYPVDKNGNNTENCYVSLDDLRALLDKAPSVEPVPVGWISQELLDDKCWVQDGFTTAEIVGCDNFFPVYLAPQDQSIEIAKLEKRCADLDERNKTQAIYIDNYIVKVAELEARLAELEKEYFNENQIAEACMFAEIPDSKCESILIALKMEKTNE